MKVKSVKLCEGGKAMSKPKSGLFNNTIGAVDGEQIKIDMHTLEDNLPIVEKQYPLSKAGYFGEKGKNVRVIQTKDPINTSQDFYNKIGKGGELLVLSNGKGTMTILSDGTRIVHRLITSTEGSPAVEITVSGCNRVKNQKIHFVKGE